MIIGVLIAFVPLIRSMEKVGLPAVRLVPNFTLTSTLSITYKKGLYKVVELVGGVGGSVIKRTTPYSLSISL